MNDDRAILTAAFEFCDRPDDSTAIVARVRAILPASIENVSDADAKTLGDRVLAEIADDPTAAAWFLAKIDAKKSYDGAKSELKPVVYVCPFGDTHWTQPSILDDVPPCDVHHVPLVLA